MRYDRASITSAIAAAARAARAHGQTAYVFAGYGGWTVDYSAPPFGRPHVAVEPCGLVVERDGDPACGDEEIDYPDDDCPEPFAARMGWESGRA